jgi:LGFP repeat
MDFPASTADGIGVYLHCEWGSIFWQAETGAQEVHGRHTRQVGLSRGAVVSPQTLYELGAEWNATRLDFNWQLPSAAETKAIFARHGLTSPFWSRE